MGCITGYPMGYPMGLSLSMFEISLFTFDTNWFSNKVNCAVCFNQSAPSKLTVWTMQSFHSVGSHIISSWHLPVNSPYFGVAHIFMFVIIDSFPVHDEQTTHVCLTFLALDPILFPFYLQSLNTFHPAQSLHPPAHRNPTQAPSHYRCYTTRCEYTRYLTEDNIRHPT